MWGCRGELDCAYGGGCAERGPSGVFVLVGWCVRRTGWGACGRQERDLVVGGVGGRWGVLSDRRCASGAVEESRVGAARITRGIGLGILLRVDFVFVFRFDALVWSVLCGKEW